MRIVLAPRGVESEMELAYAGLHQLCAPMLDRLERLPGPQREALGTAFGMTPGRRPIASSSGWQCSSLLSEVAADRPLVCVVDDAQWLDRESAQTLAFVARRLLAESVGWSSRCASRATGTRWRGFPELVVDGLTTATPARCWIRRPRAAGRAAAGPDRRRGPRQSARAARAAPGADAGGARRRLRTSRGDPLANRIEQSFLRRLESLPTETRRLLLMAAAEPVGDVPLLLACGRAARASEPTRRRPPGCRLDRVGARVRFRIRSCARRPTARRRCPSGRGSIGHWRTRRIQRSIPTAAHGIALTRRSAPTRRWRASWSARPTARRGAAAWRRLPPSWREPPS